MGGVKERVNKIQMKPNEYVVSRQSIERESFRIIEREAGNHGFPPDRWAVVRRMIHATADFDYLSSIRFHTGAIAAGIGAIKSGRKIITDIEMVKAGINKRLLRPFGCEVQCFINDSETISMAEKNQKTRAESAVELAAASMEGGIYVIGNAPTALLRLIDLVEGNRAHPALIIGLPVGFVNASESKEQLSRSGCPYLTNRGRKGGSAAAVSAVNALAHLAGETSGGR